MNERRKSDRLFICEWQTGKVGWWYSFKIFSSSKQNENDFRVTHILLSVTCEPVHRPTLFHSQLLINYPCNLWDVHYQCGYRVWISDVWYEHREFKYLIGFVRLFLFVRTSWSPKVLNAHFDVISSVHHNRFLSVYLITVFFFSGVYLSIFT